MARIYAASSWRNSFHDIVVEQLEDDGHQVYNFKDPDSAFGWDNIDPDWKNWTIERYLSELNSDANASHGFLTDKRAMEWADTCVMTTPCGRSAHLEAGYCKGRGKRVIILLINDGNFEPELMYLLADEIVTNLRDLVEILRY